MGVTARGSRYGRTLADKSFIVSSTAVALSAIPAGIPSGAKAALVTVGAEAIRFRTTGSAPTASVGHAAAAGTAIEVFGGDMINLQLIRQSADSTCFVTFFGE